MFKRLNSLSQKKGGRNSLAWFIMSNNKNRILKKNIQGLIFEHTITLISARNIYIHSFIYFFILKGKKAFQSRLCKANEVLQMEMRCVFELEFTNSFETLE